MRPIKFRAWDVVNNEMLSWNEVDNLDDDGTMPFRQIVSCAAYQLMQFTGLKDKNGKEIYEGDIVKYPGLLGGVVKFNDKYAGWRLHFTSCSYGMNIHHKNDYEIIGNIYETSELIEGGQTP